jgi:protein-arginine kinase activator protein McsA
LQEKRKQNAVWRVYRRNSGHLPDAAKEFEFERAAKLRDSIKELKEQQFLFGK